MEETTIPQLDGDGAESGDGKEKEGRNCEDEKDLRDEQVEEESIMEEKVKESVDMFCMKSK